MQAFKKILSLTLACALALSMGAVTVFAVDTAETPTKVATFAELKTAVANAGVTAIELTASPIEMTETLVIDHNLTIESNVAKGILVEGPITMERNGSVLDASKITSGYPEGKLHGIVIVNAEVTLKNIFVKDSPWYGIQVYSNAGTAKVNLNSCGIVGSAASALLVNSGADTEGKATATIAADGGLNLQNNAGGGIELTKNSALVFDSGIASLNNKPLIWLDGMTVKDAGELSVTGTQADAFKKTLTAVDKVVNGSNQVWYLNDKEMVPELSLTGLGSAADDKINVSELYPEVDGAVTVEDAENLPKTTSEVTLEANGYKDKIKMTVEVTEGKAEALQLFAVDTEGKYWNMVTAKRWGPAEGFTPSNATTKCYVLAKEPGKYTVVVKVVDASTAAEKCSATWSLTAVGPASTDATLTALSYKVGDGEAVAVPSFAAETDSYDVVLPAGTAADAAVTMEGTAAAGASVTTNAGVTLAEGKGAATVVVTAEDKTTTKTYTVNFTTEKIVPTEYTVTFDSKGGSVVEAIKTTTGTITLPAKPTKENYAFKGWFTDEALTKAFDGTGVTGNITVYAKWEAAEVPPTEYTVTFDSKGGSAVAAIKTTTGTITLPADPIKQDYAFKGWFTDEALTKAFDGTGVTGNITVYAKWEAVEVPPVPGSNADLKDLHYIVDDNGDSRSVPGFASGKTSYTVTLAPGFSSVELGGTASDSKAAVDGSKAVATSSNPVASLTVTAEDGKTAKTYTVTFKVKDETPEPPTPSTPDDKPSGGTGGGGNNVANTPETVEKVKDTVAAIKDSTLKLPADAAKSTTSGGKEITTIPVALVSGSATVGMDLFDALGSAPSDVGLKITVKSGLAGGSMEVVIPGGFGKITEPGRIGYSMDYADKAASNDDMLKAVKGEGVTSTTAKIGGNQTLPVVATITVSTKAANGTTVNIYKYDPITKKFIVIGKAVAKNGKLTFGTKEMGEMLFTTGTI